MPAFVFVSHLQALTSYAFRDIFKSRVILLLIVTSLSIAYSAVFLSTSILAGFQQMLIDGAHGYLGDVVISPTNNETSIPRIRDTLQKIENHPNIASISIRSDITASLTYNEKDAYQYRTIGISPLDESQTTKLNTRLIDGQWIDNSQPDKIVLGLTVADSLVGLEFDNETIQIGEKVTLNINTGQKKTYTVGGIIDAKTFLPNLFAILPKDEIESLSGSIHNTEIVINLKNQSQRSQTIKELEESISGISAVTWNQEAGYVDDIVTAVTFIMGLINIMLTVSVFIIMSIVIFINVFQKRRQIGIIKSMGASNAFIVSIYVLEAIAYAGLSYFIGFALYWAIHQYSLAHPVPLLIGDFHTVFRPDIVTRSIFILLVAALGGSFIPAYLAARTKIVNVIRESV